MSACDAMKTKYNLYNPPPQPDWLRETVVGLSSSWRFMVFLEAKKYAIIVCPGHTEYLDRGSGNAYCPTAYTLVEKGKNFWSHTWVRVYKGRISNAERARLEDVLKLAEKSGVDVVRDLMKEKAS